MAQQEMVDAHTEVRHTQQVEMLVTSTLTATHQIIDTSTKCSEQAGAYQSLHMHLVHQSFHHVGDDEAMVNARNLLHCQLQAGGCPTSPNPDDRRSPGNIDDLLARFDDTLAYDHHVKTFIQDGSDDDGYQE